MVSSRSNETDLEQPCFDNPKDEALYWKQIAEDYIQKLQDVRDEFDEFQEGSRELEHELEAQLEQYEQRVKDLVNTKSSLEEENEMLKEKLESTSRDTYLQITALQDENAQVKAVKEEMSKYIRELEQGNDDLERSKRATICSLEEFDARLNSAIERNAFLENELEEKEELMITVQRLKDEGRDLKADLALNSKQRHQSLSESKSKITETEHNPHISHQANDTPDGNKSNREPATPKKQIDTIEHNTPKTHHDSFELEKNRTNSLLSANSTTPMGRGNPNSMTPSSRISALNIVSDLLRKVGALESKLASCRNFVQDHPRNGKTPHNVHGVTPITDSPKGKPKNLNTKHNSKNVSGLVKVNV